MLQMPLLQQQMQCEPQQEVDLPFSQNLILSVAPHFCFAPANSVLSIQSTECNWRGNIWLLGGRVLSLRVHENLRLLWVSADEFERKK